VIIIGSKRKSTSCSRHRIKNIPIGPKIIKADMLVDAQCGLSRLFTKYVDIILRKKTIMTQMDAIKYAVTVH
jgi:hypothetical protein